MRSSRYVAGLVLAASGVGLKLYQEVEMQFHLVVLNFFFDFEFFGQHGLVCKRCSYSRSSNTNGLLIFACGNTVRLCTISSRRDNRCNFATKRQPTPSPTFPGLTRSTSPQWTTAMEKHVTSLLLQLSVGAQDDLRSAVKERLRGKAKEIGGGGGKMGGSSGNDPPGGGLGDGVLERNLGVPMVVVGCKADSLQSETFEQQQRLHFIQQNLRRFCLKCEPGSKNERFNPSQLFAVVPVVLCSSQLCNERGTGHAVTPLVESAELCCRCGPRPST